MISAVLIGNMQPQYALAQPQSIQLQQYKDEALSFQYPANWILTGIDGGGIRLQVPGQLLGMGIKVEFPTVGGSIADAMYLSMDELTQNYVQEKKGLRLVSSNIMDSSNAENIYLTEDNRVVFERLVKRDSGLMLQFFAVIGEQSLIEELKPVAEKILQTVQFDPNYEATMSEKLQQLGKMKMENEQLASDVLDLGVKGMSDTARMFDEQIEEMQEECSRKLGYETTQLYC